MGNSEVGHLTIGSGRILKQSLQRLNDDVASGALLENKVLKAAFERAQERGGNVHLLGLVSYGGVHSHIDHLRALLELAKQEGMYERTYVDAFTDGRDVSPHASVEDLAELPADRIASVIGRYYAMDRDKRWDRIEIALDALIEGKGKQTSDPVAAVQESYDEGDHRRVHQANRRRRAARASTRTTRSSSSTSAPTGRASSRASCSSAATT